MLALMLPCLGAWAQPQTSDAPTNGEWAANTTWFLITNGQGYLLSKNIADNGNLMLTQTTTNEATDDLLWCVVGDATNGYKFYNKAAGTEEVLGLTGADGSARATFVTEGTDNYTTAFEFTRSGLTGATYWCMKQKGSDNNYWNKRGNYLAYWNSSSATGNDQGSAYLFTPVNLEDIKDYTYQLTDNAGNTFEGTHKLIKNVTKVNPPVFNGAGYTVNNHTWNGDIYNATIEFPFPTSKIDGATNWTYIKTRPISSYEAYFYVNNDYVKFKTQKNTNLSYLPSSDVNEIAKYMWTIYPKYNSATGKFTFNIKNSASNKYLPTVSGAINNIQLSETAGDFSWDIANEYYGFCIPNTNIFLNAGTSNPNEQAAAFWAKSGNRNHQGVNLVFCAPIYTANCRLTDNSGNEYSIWKATFNYTVEEGDVELPNITGVPTSLINNGTWNEGVCSATINFPFAVTNGEKINPTFICTYGNDTFKWKAIGTGIKTVKNVSATSANIAEHLWEIIPDFDNGAFKFQIKNLATGTYINSTSNGDTHNEGTVSLSETASDVTFESNGFKLSTGKFLSIGSSTGNTGAEQVLGTWSSHSGTTLCFPIAKYTVEVGDAGYASLYTPVAGTFAGEVKTYAVTKDGIVNGYANLTELTGVAANQGAIIKATPGTYTFTAGSISSDWSNNLLTGTSVNKMIEGEAYVLGNADGVGLYKAQLTDGSFLNNAGKAYLPASAVSTTAQALRFNFGGNTTAIESVLNNGADANAPIYDLTGRRVVNAVKGGIYIQNGKKFIVK